MYVCVYTRQEIYSKAVIYHISMKSKLLKNEWKVSRKNIHLYKNFKEIHIRIVRKVSLLKIFLHNCLKSRKQNKLHKETDVPKPNLLIADQSWK